MITVVLLGFGNVNFHLSKAFSAANEVELKAIYTRKSLEAPSFLSNFQFTTKLHELPEADVYIIGIPDDAISAFSNQLRLEDKLVLHTSGGIPLSELSNEHRRGVFYPLQTFSKNHHIGFSDIPICIEAENASDLATIEALGKMISNKVVEISSEERGKLHLAAVFANNFTNYMYTVASEITSENNLDFDLLKPLICETANKIVKHHPSEIQTGPAKRRDQQTINKHLALLNDSNKRQLYTQLTQAIKEAHGKEL